MSGNHFGDEDLIACVLNESDPGKSAEMERHAATCPGCAESLRRLGLAVEGFRNAPAPGAPARVLVHLLEAQADIRERTSSRRTAAWIPAAWRNRGRRVPAGAAALVVATALVFFGGYQLGQRNVLSPASEPVAGAPERIDPGKDPLPRIAFQTLPPMEIPAAVPASRVGERPTPRGDVRDSL